MRAVAASLVFFLSLLAAGCGGGGGGGGLADESGASVAPATVPVFVSMNSDLDSEQWNTAEDLLDKFPGSDRVIAELRKSLTEEGVDYERDVKPALGDEVSIVWLDFENGGDNVVVVADAKDEAKMNELLAKGDDPPRHEQVDGFTVIADEQAAIDRFKQARGEETLEDNEVFTQAVEDLPTETIAQVFVNGRRATEALQGELSGLGAASALRNQKLEWASVALESVSNGIRLVGHAKGAGGTVENYTPKLLSSVPAGALAVISFRGAGDQVAGQLEQNPSLQGQLSQLEQVLGTTLEELTKLFGGEGVLYVREAAPIPEITLLLEHANPTDAVATVDRLVARAGTLTSLRPTTSTVEGVTVKTLSFGNFAVSYAGFDGKLVLTTNQTAVGDIRGGLAENLTADADFEAAGETAELGDQTAGFIYMNVRRTLELAAGFARLAGQDIPPELDANSRPLQSFLMHASREGDETSFTGFLEIE